MIWSMEKRMKKGTGAATRRVENSRSPRKRENRLMETWTPSQRLVTKNVHNRPVEGLAIVGCGEAVRFNSVADAAAWAYSRGASASFDATRHRISDVLRGHRESAYGYRWRYVQV